MGNATPTDTTTKEPDTPPPAPWTTISSGGYLTLLHQPSSGRPEQPAVIPLPPTETMYRLAQRVRQAVWPRDVAEFEDEVERIESVARWLTMRGVACLSWLAKGLAEPPRDLLDQVLATPFGYAIEDFDDPTETPTEPEDLRETTAELGRLLLTALASRVRSALDPGAAITRPVRLVANLANAAVFAHDQYVDGPAEPEFWRLRQEHLRTELAAALMSSWYVHPELQVPLACANAVHELIREWVERGVGNTDVANADLATAVHMRLATFTGPGDLGVPVQEWARGLLASNQPDGHTTGDIEAWRA